MYFPLITKGSDSLENILPAKLQNGIYLVLTDLSRPYFGDYNLVRVQISAAVDPDGDEVIYTRTVEKMAVPTAEMDNARAELLAEFRVTSLPYISAESFPEKARKLKLLQKKEPARGYAGVRF